ncbi:MAG: hypothetical protein JSS10_06360 [Verrucomicrobia bacterium]|nr:hypothetical protein [Verrucomicrobiota bacterium]
MLKSDEKRLFFAAQTIGVWPREFPGGRILDEENRHLTLAFLGSTSLSHLLKKMKSFPIPAFHLGIGGYTTKWVFLPHKHEARVVAAEIEEFSQFHLIDYHKAVVQWLQAAGYPQKDTRPFFPHITVARGSFDVGSWEKIPCQIPFYISSISLLESLGNSHYKPLWQHTLIPPFEEIEHTADIAFLIRGKDIQDLWLHAQLALAFKFPPLIPYLSKEHCDSLDNVTAALNNLIARADLDIGVPFKAVSYHHEMTSYPHYLEWRMIVDV